MIIKPREENASSSEDTKKDIKSKIDVLELEIGITKVKKVTNGAVVIGCENKIQAEALKNKVSKDLGEKYMVLAPRKRKLKVKISDVDKENGEDELDFWGKIEEQNGFEKASTVGKIVYKSSNAKSQRTTIIAEVDAGTYRKLLEEGKVKIGWNMCRVQDYIGILRCFKCCGYYHFAKDCVKEETCGKCAGKYATKKCNNDSLKLRTAKKKLKVLKLKI